MIVSTQKRGTCTNCKCFYEGKNGIVVREGERWFCHACHEKGDDRSMRSSNEYTLLLVRKDTEAKEGLAYLTNYDGSYFRVTCSFKKSSYKGSYRIGMSNKDRKRIKNLTVKCYFDGWLWESKLIENFYGVYHVREVTMHRVRKAKLHESLYKKRKQTKKWMEAI